MLGCTDLDRAVMPNVVRLLAGMPGDSFGSSRSNLILLLQTALATSQNKLSVGVRVPKGALTRFESAAARAYTRLTIVALDVLPNG